MRLRSEFATGAVVLAAAASLAAVPAGATPSGQEQGYGKSSLQRDAEAIAAFGVSGVQAWKTGLGGRNVVASSGVSDIETNRPVPPSAYFRIGSNNKMFVATVVLQLVGEGKLRLDDTVERWLPGVVQGNGNRGGKITIRHLRRELPGV
nr:serine hydrolase domain-containing protein [Streptomyces sporangiiformans]